ncbi:unnamed protein product [Cochlearia groenlandica]
MEEEAIETHYWCHACSDFVNPLIDGDILTCNLCQTGFVEEVIPAPPVPLTTTTTDHHDHDDDDDDDDESNDGETDLDQRVEDFISTRRGNAAAILALLQEIRAGLPAESESNDGYRSSQELAVLIDSFNERLRIQDSLRSGGGGASSSVVPSGSLGDYFVGSGFDSLIERLTENDLNDRYGTPPATKEAVESLATVKVVPEESLLLLLQCTVCLDGFEIGIEAKEMPCKHVFHRECLLPWLELHSSCPVCRYLLPRNDDDDDDDGESKNDAEEMSRNDDDNSVASMEGNDGSSLESRSMNRGEF